MKDFAMVSRTAKPRSLPPDPVGGSSDSGGSKWTFLTNHASVLLHIAANPDDTLREIAAAIGLTERTTASVIADLRESRYIHVSRRGRHNHYRVNKAKHLRRSVHKKATIGSLIHALSAANEEAFTK